MTAFCNETFLSSEFYYKSSIKHRQLDPEKKQNT